jgi:16S rRNA (uracil1498-N3)-methyltransferase
LIPLGAEAARHGKALRLRAGAAVELAFPEGAWSADVTEMDRERMIARLVAPLSEDREPPFALHGFLPLTAQLSLWDDWLPPLVELGITRITPVIYARSEFDANKTAARRERWERVILSACEQSHRSRVPSLEKPIEFKHLLSVASPQKWVAYELSQSTLNPALLEQDLAFTSGPEGGITDEEFVSLSAASWQSVSLGKSILRAVTAPVALLGAVQYQWGAKPTSS